MYLLSVIMCVSMCVLWGDSWQNRRSQMIWRNITLGKKNGGRPAKDRRTALAQLTCRDWDEVRGKTQIRGKMWGGACRYQHTKCEEICRKNMRKKTERARQLLYLKEWKAERKKQFWDFGTKRKRFYQGKWCKVWQYIKKGEWMRSIQETVGLLYSKEKTALHWRKEGKHQHLDEEGTLLSRLMM